MKLTKQQSQFIETAPRNFCIEVIDYGFYSNGCVSIKRKDDNGLFVINIDKNAKYILKK